MVMQQKIATPAFELAGQGAIVPVIRAEGAGPVHVPNGNFLLNAQFERAGDDLVLTGRDGTKLLVVDYFGHGTPPSLVTESGAEIPGDLAEKLAGPPTPGAYAQAGGGSPRPAIGAVEALTGDATAMRLDGTRAPLAVGAPVFQGDVVETTPGSRLAIVFVDKTTFTLDSATRMVLDELVYNPGTEGRSAFSLVQGTFVYISGEVAKLAPQNVQIRTPVATVGIRGTEVGFVILGPGDAGGASFTVLDGQIAVQNAGGSQILGAGFVTNVTSSFTAPAAPLPAPPSNIAAQYGALRGYGANAIINSTIRLQRDQQQLQPPPAPGRGEGPVTGGMRAASGESGSNPGEQVQSQQGEQAALSSIAPAAGPGEAGLSTGIASIFGPSATIKGPLSLATTGITLAATGLGFTNSSGGGDHSRAGAEGGDHRVAMMAAQPASAGGEPTVPVAVPDQSVTVADMGPTQIDVLANDTKPAGANAIAIVSIDTETTIGTATIDPGGATITYVAGAAFQHLGAGQTATDTFSYTISDALGVMSTATVTVIVTGVNDAPTAVGDAADAADGGSVTIAALANDIDPDDGDSKTIVAVNTSETAGSVSIAAGGASLLYSTGNVFQMLGAGQTAVDEFSYTMEDSAGVSSTATVSITITGVNDAPVAEADNASLTAGGSVQLAVLDNDFDPDNGDSKTILSINTAGTQGTVTVLDPGPVPGPYTPVPGLGIFNLTLANFSPQIEYASGIAFQGLKAGETATDSFTYTLADSFGVQSTATVTLVITGVNDAPLAVPDVVGAQAGSTISIDALSNDRDPDVGDTRTIIAINTTGTAGTVGIVGNGAALSYSTGPGFAGVPQGDFTTDKFTYTMVDGAGVQSTALVTVLVLGVNDAPTDILASATSVNENVAAGTTVAALAMVDPDIGDTATFSLVDNAGGRFAIAGNQLVVAGALDHELAASQNITVRATDAHGAFIDKTFAIAIADVNEAPAITSNGGGGVASIFMLEAKTLVTTVTAVDPDMGQTLTYAITGGADASKFFINSATGKLSFQAAPIFDNPGDFGGNNIYDVNVSVSDGSLTDVQSLAIAVLDDQNVDPDDFDSLGLPGSQVLSGSGSGGVLYGGADGDVIAGGSSQDTIFGGSGNDTIAGNDTPSAGGTDPDEIHGGSGSDLLAGGGGNDIVLGGSGNDTVSGGDGNDVVTGGVGNDSLAGGQGEDQLIGGSGADLMTGGQGNDRFVFNSLSDGAQIATNLPAIDAGVAIDMITDFVSGQDKIVLNMAAFSPASAFFTIGGAYAGSVPGAQPTPSFILDGTGNLNYDADPTSPGYTVVANVGTQTPLVASDLQFTPSGT